ncbi:MAG TPA: hypothetical protein DCP51_03460 [Clostridiales bacterium]|nr:hypothetical protein [Clostridiales bacterium]
MGIVLDFLKTEGKKTFKELGFGPVDALILSQLTYLNYDAAFTSFDGESQPLPLLAITPFAKSGLLFKDIRSTKECERLYFLFLKSRRYMGTQLSYFVNDIDQEAEKQFSAVVFGLSDGTDFVAFRGTDNTIVGWKEDFNMTFMYPIPAQTESVKYLNKVAVSSKRPLRVGGHSKGGNLAVYSSAKCDPKVKERIIEIFNLDGPGFRQEFFDNPDFIEIKNRVKKFIPCSSIVGMLMLNQGNYIVVDSNKNGFMQHDLFNWQVENGDFIYKETVRNSSILLDRTVSDWLSSLDDTKRKIFFDTLYSLIKQTNVKTLFEFNDQKRKNARIILHAAKAIDPQTRKFVINAFASFLLFAPKEYKNIKLLNIKKSKNQANKDKA